MIEVMYEGRSYKSSEHLYQHLKCKFLKYDTLAQEVIEADTAMEAKKLTEKIGDVSHWFKNNEDAMRTVLKAKAASCPDFHNLLVNSGSNYIVEATNDKYWGCGLSSVSNAMYTLPDYHPGKNRLGHLMMELRTSLRQISTAPETNTPEPTQQCIVQLPSSLLAMTQYSPNSVPMTTLALPVPGKTTTQTTTETTTTHANSDPTVPINSDNSNIMKTDSTQKHGANHPMLNTSTPTTSKKQQEASDRGRSKTKLCSIDRFMVKMNDRSLSKKRRITDENENDQ